MEYSEMNPPYEQYKEKFNDNFDPFLGKENWETPNNHLI